MPSPRYTNADLARFERKPLGIAIEAAPVAPYEEPTGPSVDDLLGQARYTLGRANQLKKATLDTPSYTEERVAAQQQSAAEPSVMDSALTRLSKQAQHYLETRPEALDIGTLPLSMIPGPWQVPAAAWQGARSAQRLAEGGMERAKAQPFTTGLDALVAGGTAGAALRALRGLVGSRAVSTAVPKGLMAGRTPKALPPASASTGPFPQGPSSLTPPAVIEGISVRPQLLERNPIARPFQQGPSTLPTPGTLGSGPTPRGYLGPGRPELQLGPAPSRLPPSSLAGLRNAGRMPSAVELGVADAGHVRSGAGLPMRPTELNPEASIPFNDAAPFRVPSNKHAIDIEAALAGDAPALEVVEGLGANASGESAASLEALQRMAGMKTRGQSFAVRGRGGKIRKLTGPDAVDYRVQPGEQYGILGPKGEFLVKDVGEPVQALLNTPAFKKLARARALGTSR